jgi:hypothetical protein
MLEDRRFLLSWNSTSGTAAFRLLILRLILEYRRFWLTGNGISGTATLRVLVAAGGREEDLLVFNLVLDLELLLAMDDDAVAGAAAVEVLLGIVNSEAAVPADDGETLVVTDGCHSRLFILELQEAEAEASVQPSLRGPRDDVLGIEGAYEVEAQNALLQDKQRTPPSLLPRSLPTGCSPCTGALQDDIRCRFLDHVRQTMAA